MKKFSLICCFVFLALTVFGQAYEKRHSAVSIGYGFFNMWKSFLDKVIDIPEYKVKATGPLTFIYEYGISKRFSAGILGSYSRVNGKAEKFQLSDQITFWTLHARANYHFWTSKKIDPYFGGGIGINNAKYKNLDPNTYIPPEAYASVPSTLDFSGQVGIKYFLSNHFGLYMEAGYVSGAILHVGLTGQF
jgi:outer membrane protein W